MGYTQTCSPCLSLRDFPIQLLHFIARDSSPFAHSTLRSQWRVYWGVLRPPIDSTPCLSVFYITAAWVGTSFYLGPTHLAKLSSVPARWPEPNAGVVRHCVMGSIFGSWFFWFFFVSRQKEHNVLMRGAFHKVIVAKTLASLLGYSVVKNLTTMPSAHCSHWPRRPLNIDCCLLFVEYSKHSCRQW